MSEDDITAVLLELFNLRNEIVMEYGLYRPTRLPSYDNNENGDPFEYGSVPWLKRFYTNGIVNIFDRLLQAANYTIAGNGGACAMDARCVHAIRVANYFQRTTIIWRADVRNTSSIFYQCGEILIGAFRKLRNGKNMEKRIIDIERRLTSMIDEQHSRHKSLKSIYRWRFQSRYYSLRKKTVCEATNNFITEQWATAVENMRREVQPDANYMRRLALYELIIHHCTNMTAGQLLSFNELLVRCYSVYSDLLYNSDNLLLLTAAYEMGRARLHTKLIEVNERNCRCFAKCVGPIGDMRQLEKRVWDSFQRHSGLVVCGACRLSPIVESTTAEKPRRTHSSITPEVESCSVDGCSSYKLVRLVVNDVRATKTGLVHIRYAHRFFATNSVNVTDEASGRKQGGTQARFYGVCYSGRRACKKRFIISSPSAGAVESRSTPPYSDTTYWFRCSSCQQKDSEDATWSLAQRTDCSRTESQTCLRRWFMSDHFPKEKMCRGCKIAATCAHLDEVLYRNITTARSFLPNVVKKCKRLTALRWWLCRPEAWFS